MFLITSLVSVYDLFQISSQQISIKKLQDALNASQRELNDFRRIAETEVRQLWYLHFAVDQACLFNSRAWEI